MDLRPQPLIPRHLLEFEHYYVKTGYHPFYRQRRAELESMMCYVITPHYGVSYLDVPSTGFVDDIVNQKTSLLRTKLDVLTAQLHERLNIREDNLHALDYDECRMGTLFHHLYFANGSRYLGGDRRLSWLEGKSFDLQNERRKQDVECWRDIAMLSRDLLAAWEAYEHAKARGQLVSAQTRQASPCERCAEEE